MSARRPCPVAPGPLEDFAVQFDPLFSSYAQRANFRNYVSGLLLPRDRNKTLTALAGAEPVVQAQAAPVQRLQFFLSNQPGMPMRSTSVACSYWQRTRRPPRPTKAYW